MQTWFHRLHERPMFVCVIDANRLCATTDITERKDIIDCLESSRDTLSPQCAVALTSEQDRMAEGTCVC